MPLLGRFPQKAENSPRPRLGHCTPEMASPLKKANVWNFGSGAELEASGPRPRPSAALFRTGRACKHN